MLVIEYTIKNGVYGLGIFAEALIPQGGVVYIHYDAMLLNIKLSDIAQYPIHAKNALLKYAYDGGGAYHLPDSVYLNVDDSRFMNHSFQPNIVWDDEKSIYTAQRNINAGEEILCDYSVFCTAGMYCFAFIHKTE